MGPVLVPMMDHRFIVDFPIENGVIFHSYVNV